jgi:hypothetical protein
MFLDFQTYQFTTTSTMHHTFQNLHSNVDFKPNQDSSEPSQQKNPGYY